MQSVNVKLPSSRGTEMAGTIDFPDAPPLAFAVFAHCFAGSRHTPGAARTSKQLTEFGIATLRFDFPGLGQSEGEFADTTFNQNVDDIRAAADWLEEHYSAPQMLIGHSLGGAAVLKAATAMKKIRAVATIGAPFDPAHSVLHYADKIGEVDANGEVEVVLGGRALTISRKFLEDLAETNPEEYLPRLRKPLLSLHSPIDQTVGIDNAQNIFRMTRYPKSLVSLDKADHLLTKQGTAARAADLIGAWSRQFIVPDYEPEEVGTDAAVARPATGTKFGVVVRHNDHSVTADRTKKEGGKGKGFTATGLLMSALASASTQAIKEAGKKLALDDVHVTITQTGTTSFERRIELKGSLSDSDIDALRAAARDTDVERMAAGATITDVVDAN
ncbi:alpha/beta fold hydrolase [Corynebacterium accolens]|uniref:bifunctional alpha/beta hydrolase/OsmC family protein n=1 Tax=Corynebacterium accolens TaxID=38284 RepID=UPI002542EE5A|nr:alpha/beta fold hydrolase [Corynebacterium accolens]MDK4276726.1 alpha/beta fold hydrolase [Corynebacterium accolens]MDK4294101.1 alpha/beta fold hydrolase [Corynebacterium accolens]WKS62545.1 alpha/beta fold hydrolase [Corynebacterium accolens]WKS68167.1 alpha/beta fold hydrolase [Corynebacterium accolens]WKS70532.1 alpha/beta fold hydrolase [Corynebacterium accolens]